MLIDNISETQLHEVSHKERSSLLGPTAASVAEPNVRLTILPHPDGRMRTQLNYSVVGLDPPHPFSV